MTIKELIKTLERRNEINAYFNKDHEQLQIVFDDIYYLYVDNLKDFAKYLKETYYKPYCEALYNAQLENVNGHMKTIFVANCNGLTNAYTIEIWLTNK